MWLVAWGVSEAVQNVDEVGKLVNYSYGTAGDIAILLTRCTRGVTFYNNKPCEASSRAASIRREEVNRRCYSHLLCVCRMTCAFTSMTAKSASSWRRE